jgi:hypothetical protein
LSRHISSQRRGLPSADSRRSVMQTPRRPAGRSFEFRRSPVRRRMSRRSHHWSELP